MNKNNEAYAWSVPREAYDHWDMLSPQGRMYVLHWNTLKTDTDRLKGDDIVEHGLDYLLRECKEETGQRVVKFLTQNWSTTLRVLLDAAA